MARPGTELPIAKVLTKRFMIGRALKGMKKPLARFALFGLLICVGYAFAFGLMAVKRAQSAYWQKQVEMFRAGCMRNPYVRFSCTQATLTSNAACTCVVDSYTVSILRIE